MRPYEPTLSGPATAPARFALRRRGDVFGTVSVELTVAGRHWLLRGRCQSPQPTDDAQVLPATLPELLLPAGARAGSGGRGRDAADGQIVLADAPAEGVTLGQDVWVLSGTVAAPARVLDDDGKRVVLAVDLARAGQLPARPLPRRTGPHEAGERQGAAALSWSGPARLGSDDRYDSDDRLGDRAGSALLPF